ncbi:hypothetical protein Scep_011882 [Stephania cephalantha]|uniref:ATP-dependent DNA helicase n=1 Tax=Stephania cephalantha TaxID=152367 RepID=A0AAP0P6Y5_9MAGN
MCEDFYKESLNISEVVRKAMQEIYYIFRSMGKDIRTYNLNWPSMEENENENIVHEIAEEIDVEVSFEDLMLQSNLNDNQRLASNLIVDKVLKNESGMFFIDGPGGTGKTFLYRAILVTIRSQKLANCFSNCIFRCSSIYITWGSHSTFEI